MHYDTQQCICLASRPRGVAVLTITPEFASASASASADALMLQQGPGHFSLPVIATQQVSYLLHVVCSLFPINALACMCQGTFEQRSAGADCRSRGTSVPDSRAQALPSACAECPNMSAECAKIVSFPSTLCTLQIKCLMHQLIAGVQYLHDNWVIHRDLKTSNILYNNKGDLKICDFGLARQYGSPLRPYTHLVVTLWYRAPELLLGEMPYAVFTFS